MAGGITRIVLIEHRLHAIVLARRTRTIPMTLGGFGEIFRLRCDLLEKFRALRAIFLGKPRPQHVRERDVGKVDSGLQVQPLQVQHGGPQDADGGAIA